MKPLFVPLKKNWFTDFKNGTKNLEFRGYGPRWNEQVCKIGREVTLRLGYSGEVLKGRVVSFEKIPLDSSPIEAQQLYNGRFEYIAAIGVKLD